MTSPGDLRYPFNALVSYHYYRNVDLDELARAGLRLVGDSGAFSAATLGVQIGVDEFADWAHRWKHCLCWIASLDVIGQPEGTWANFRRLRDKHGLDVVPSIHAGDDARKWITRYAEEGVDFIGLGGLVAHRNRPLATLPWLADVMRFAQDQHPEVRFHGWGCTNPTLLRALPYYSVDSSNLGSGYRYARQVAFDPRTAKWVGIALDGHDPYRHHDLLSRYYGVQARDILKSTSANRTALVRLGGRSYQYVEDYLRARHGVVPAPHYGVSDPIPGPNVLAALSGEDHRLGAPGPHVHSADSNPGHLLRLRASKITKGTR